MYPTDIPASGMNVFATEGAYTPDDAVKGMRDLLDPLNKMTFRRTFGMLISLLQNFVNAHYLGRANCPVESGFITNLINTNLITTSGIHFYYNTYDGGIIKTNSNLELEVKSNDVLRLTTDWNYPIYITPGAINPPAFEVDYNNIYTRQPLNCSGIISDSIVLSTEQTVMVSGDANVTPTSSRMHIEGSAGTITLLAGSLKSGMLLFVTGEAPTSISNGIHAYDLSLDNGATLILEGGTWQFLNHPSDAM